MSDEVSVWFSQFHHPLKEVMLHMRAVLLEADSRIEECIKWKSPTFVFKGNIASFNPRTKAHASLMFHAGASIPGDFPHLEGTGNVARYLKVTSLQEARQLAPELRRIARSWCAMKGG